MWYIIPAAKIKIKATTRQIFVEEKSNFLLFEKFPKSSMGQDPGCKILI